MVTFNRLLTILIFTGLLYVNQATACQRLRVANVFEEIKGKEGDFIITESEGGFYIDPNLLVLRDDGIHLSYGESDFLMPFMYHDTVGYFLSPEACRNFDNHSWMCCECFHVNQLRNMNCGECGKRRCKKMVHD